MTKPLPPESLYRRCDAAQFAFDTTAELEEFPEILGQERAVEAVRFGVGIRREGYNLYALGPAGIGKHSFIRRFLQDRAATERQPADWCYVNNFERPYKPRALKLPPGRAAKLRADMNQLVDELRAAIPAAFESDEYRSRAESIDREFHERQERAVGELGKDAAGQGIALLHTPTGFSFAPMKNGEVISPDEYSKLSKEEQQRLVEAMGALEVRLQKILRQIPKWRKEAREKLKQLHQEFTMFAVGHLIDDLKAQHSELSDVLSYLDAVQDDVLASIDQFRRPAEAAAAPFGAASEEGGSFFRRYQVNVLVGNGADGGAPVIYEDNPSYQGLVGRTEHVSQYGALVTDFTLIKPGALHRANGGYLLLDVLKLLSQPFAWEGLKRALNSREIRIESLGQMLSLISTVSLEPEPIPLDVKVILFGDRLFYYLLTAYDPEFSELFKVAADFEEEVDRSDSNHALYARVIGTLARKEELLPLDRGAVARVIEHSARLVGDAEKLSTHMRSVGDLLREADHWAREAGRQVVGGEDIQCAIDTRIRRADRIKQRVHEAILRGTVLIDTSGARIGQVNGLSVFELGHYAFAQPTRITATTRFGDGKVIDIEREVNLSGAIHSKGVMILSSFLAERYAKNRPMSLSASLVFEQTYGGVEGDSASVAELCALLSSLSGVPIRQSLAVTGSVNQYGQVQAIGAVNEKIEGFFDICNVRGLTGEHGVLVPASNVKHLMLRQDIVRAAEAGKFHIYPVETVDEAIELLTGVPAGDPTPVSVVPERTINYKVMARLAELSTVIAKRARKERGKNNHD